MRFIKKMVDNSSLGKRLGPRVFVTVGTTTFDELIQTVLSEDFVQVNIRAIFIKIDIDFYYHRHLFLFGISPFLRRPDN